MGNPNARPSVLLVGCGRIVEHGHAPVYQANRPQIDVCALVDISRKRRDVIGTMLGISEARRFDSIEAALEACSINVAVVAVPTGQHREAVARLLHASISVVCEKPLAPRLDDALALAALANSHTALSVVHNYRFAPRFVALTEIIRAQAGSIKEIEIRAAESGPLCGYDECFPEWRSDMLQHGTCLHDQGYHYIDWIEHVVGSRIVEVGPNSFEGSRSYGAISALLSLQNGVRAKLSVDWISAQHHTTTILAKGDHGEVEFLDDTGAVKIWRPPADLATCSILPVNIADDGFGACLVNYITATATSRVPPTCLSDAIHVLTVVDSCVAACMDMRPIAIKP